METKQRSKKKHKTKQTNKQKKKPAKNRLLLFETRALKLFQLEAKASVEPSFLFLSSKGRNDVLKLAPRVKHLTLIEKMA